MYVYIQHKEVEFHLDTEQINLETIWWPIVQVSDLTILYVCKLSYL